MAADEVAEQFDHMRLNAADDGQYEELIAAINGIRLDEAAGIVRELRSVLGARLSNKLLEKVLRQGGKNMCLYCHRFDFESINDLMSHVNQRRERADGSFFTHRQGRMVQNTIKEFLSDHECYVRDIAGNIVQDNVGEPVLKRLIDVRDDELPNAAAQEMRDTLIVRKKCLVHRSEVADAD